jgi:hypothetical protein
MSMATHHHSVCGTLYFGSANRFMTDRLLLDFDLLIAVSFIAVFGLACASLLRLIYLLAMGKAVAAGRFLRAVLFAGWPVILSMLAFVVVFMTLDPLWPVQDQTPEQQLVYAAARAAADQAYRLVGLANVLASLWSASRLFRVWKNSRLAVHAVAPD